MALVPFVVAWLAVGAIAVVVMHRRGHDAFSWALVFLVLGPLAIPVAVSADRHRPPELPSPMHAGAFDVLVAHDGTQDADLALTTVLQLFGSQLTSLTLAAVVDFEAATTVRGRQTMQSAQERLRSVVDSLPTTLTVPVDTVVLHGEPGECMQRFAAEHGYELIATDAASAVGTRLVRTSSLRKPASEVAAVPVLVAPSASAR